MSHGRIRDRPVYNQSQMSQYFDRIRLSSTQRIFSVASLSSDEKLAFLTLLKKHHLLTIPYENLQAHYSWHKGVSVSPAHLFQKIVGHQRGGWCFEMNQFLNTILLSLGFEAFLVISRVFEPLHNRYGGLMHCVNIVQVGDVQYLLDVGFGAAGPTRPVPLVGGSETMKIHAGPVAEHSPPRAQMRVTTEVIPQQVSQNRLEVYQFREGSDQDWKPAFCFDKTFELLPKDIEGLNAQGMARTCFLSRELLVQRFTSSAERIDRSGTRSFADAVAGELDGSLVLYQNRLKWRRRGNLKLDIEFQDESQRIEGLRRFFGLALEEDECEGIRGTVGEIQGSWFRAALNAH